MGGHGVGMQGGPRGGMPQGAPKEQNSYDYDKQQAKYDEKIKKILSDEQYEGYLKLKPQFASQRRIREFLLGASGGAERLMGGQQDLLSDQGAPDGMGRPGGPGSRNTNITYKGATELKTGSTEDSHTYQSSKTDPTVTAHLAAQPCVSLLFFHIINFSCQPHARCHWCRCSGDGGGIDRLLVTVDVELQGRSV